MCCLFQPENFAAFKSSQMGAANPGSNSASSALSLGCYSLVPSTPWAPVSCHCHPALEVRGWMVLSSSNCQFSSVQLLSHVWLFVTSWSAAHQASLSITNSRSSCKLMSIELVIPSNHLILCHPLLFLPSTFPSIRVFTNESVLASGGQRIGVSASASVLPMNIRGWFPLGLTGWISLLSKELSRVFFNIAFQKH